MAKKGHPSTFKGRTYEDIYGDKAEEQRQKRKVPHPGRRFNLSKFLVKGVPMRTTLKARLYKDGLLEERCSKCGLGPRWQEEGLILQIDHIDGNNRNNDLSNLRILCPNCHAQTPTYGLNSRLKKTLVTTKAVK